MELLNITLIIISVYFILAMIIKGALIGMYLYGMYQIFKDDTDLTDDTDPELNFPLDGDTSLFDPPSVESLDKSPF